MAAPTFDGGVPTPAAVYPAQMDQMRQNNFFLLTMAAAASYMLPGWTTTRQGSDGAKPDSYTMTMGSLGMKFIFTWAGDDIGTIKYQFDKGLGAGYEDIYLGTLSIAFDGNGDFAGVTPS